MDRFQIIVNAMLGWSEEAKSPRKSPGRHAAAAPSRFAEEDELAEDELEPEEEAPGFPRAGAATDMDEAEAVE